MTSMDVISISGKHLLFRFCSHWLAQPYFLVIEAMLVLGPTGKMYSSSIWYTVGYLFGSLPPPAFAKWWISSTWRWSHL